MGLFNMLFKTKKSAVKTLAPPEPIKNPVKPLVRPYSPTESAAALLDRFCATNNLTYWRKRTDQGMSKIGLVSKNGETLIDQDPNTHESVRKVTARAEQLIKEGLWNA
jgi:hypothetical protein